MAEKTVVISQQILKPIKILKWKVREGFSVSIGSLVLLYDFEKVDKKQHRKLKSPQAGTVCKLIAQEGAIIQPGEALFELEACIHPTVMKDMCAECGADLRKDDLNSTASVPMIHAVPELKVSEELAQKLGKADGERLLRDKKLVLLVDLDQTLIHTTNDIIPPNLKDVYHFQLYGPNSPWYHTRLRPGTHQFLANVSAYFELHICTFGARNYAHRITAILDADERFFSNRVLSRDECFNPTSKTANLKALFPCGDHMVCIIDDREDVWSHASNLIHVKPYHFFQHTGDINAPPGLEKHENDDKEGVDLTKIKATDLTEEKVEDRKNGGSIKDENTKVNPADIENTALRKNDDAKISEEQSSDKQCTGDNISDEQTSTALEKNKTENVVINVNGDTSTEFNVINVDKCEENQETAIEDESYNTVEENKNISQEKEKVDICPEKKNVAISSEKENIDFSSEETNKDVSLEKENQDISPEKGNTAISSEKENIDISPKKANKEVSLEIGNNKVSLEKETKDISVEKENVALSLEKENIDSSPEKANKEVSLEKETKNFPEKENTVISSENENMEISLEKATKIETDEQMGVVQDNNIEQGKEPQPERPAQVNVGINNHPENNSLLNASLNLIEIEDPDDYLLYLEDILKRIHRAFYEEYDKMESGEVPDLKKVIPAVKGNVLKGCKMIFSGLVPTHIKLQHSRAFQVAKSLGAKVTPDFEDTSTHLVAVRPGTAKVNAGRRRKNLKIVTPDWLWACAERWEHVDENIFPLNSKGSKNRHPPPHCSSPEHVPNYAVHDTPTSRKRSPSGRFMDTINPLMSFSSADIADMDKEVEDTLDTESESEDDVAKIMNVSEETIKDKEESSSSSAESLTAEMPRGHKRSLDVRNEEDYGEEDTRDSDDSPSTKFRRGEQLDSDLDIGQESNSEGSVEPPDEIDDGEWNMMGAALEREFLSNS